MTVTLSPGFADTVIASQAVFRAVAEALSRPGTLIAVPEAPPAPAPLFPSTGAVALALADMDAPVFLDSTLDTSMARDWLRFHAGCPIGSAGEATFALIGEASALTSLDAFAVGTPEFPDRSATLIVQVAGLGAGAGKRLSGPGIKGEARLTVDGLPAAFWDAWTANRALFPQGVDVIFATPTTLCGLPRTTRVED